MKTKTDRRMQVALMKSAQGRHLETAKRLNSDPVIRNMLVSPMKEQIEKSAYKVAKKKRA